VALIKMLENSLKKFLFGKCKAVADADVNA
jgi:hypothetical protein